MKHMYAIGIAALCVLVAACTGVQLRGMLGTGYVSTARPAIALAAKNLPLITAGEGTAALDSSGALGGVRTRVWLAVYGDEAGRGPVAITAHAEVPHGWYWDGIMRRPFSVNEGTEVFNDTEYQACTYIVDSSRDPFSVLDGGKDTTPVKWLARGFAARYNYYNDKIVLEYREPLPQGIVSLSALPVGLGDFVKAFEQRARETFSVGPVPSGGIDVRQGYAQNIRWRYMDERFLGTVSKYESMSSR